ncbi:hypothetical protein NV379_16945 [Paenibacillus sp. N1-5-1-14]|uniref:hypothetical protein n=1 Tax=Paenibacillus radicibacter TaxID=2972488 RepID=UPI00215972EF|nr:hypothetical protein [Paenibacillus radicibacter]MCR8644342.1 hypothetical protein [Paenibacillus radicibacter]
MKKNILWTSVLLGISAFLLICVFAFQEPKGEAQEQEQVVQSIETRYGIEKDWQLNGENNLYWTKLDEGTLTERTTGVVLTDTDCEQDAKGVSECNNIIRLANNEEITVINIHNMAKHPCFAPGQQVNVIPTENDEWMLLSKI